MHASSQNFDSLTPPVAKQAAFEQSIHGQNLHDCYHWIRDKNWQDVMRDPKLLQNDIRSYLEAENAYTEAFFQHDQILKQSLVDEMRGRIREDDSSVPLRDGDYMYYTRYETGAQYPIFARRFVKDQDFSAAQEQVLLNGQTRGVDLPYFSIGSVVHSPCHRYVAFSLDTSGNEYYSISVLDLQTGQELSNIVTHCSGSLVWTPCSGSLFYVHLDENHRSTDVYEHRLDWSDASCPSTQKNRSMDTHLYHEDDAGFFVGIGVTQSRRFLIISAHDHETSDVRLVDLNTDTRHVASVLPRIVGHEYSFAHHDETLFMLTNKQDAVDFQICSTPLAPILAGEIQNPDTWDCVVAHRPGRYISSMDCVKGTLIFSARENARTDVFILSLEHGDHTPKMITFDEETYALSFSLGYGFEDREIRLYFSSMATPSQTLSYHLDTGEKTCLKRQEVPSGHDSSRYIVERIWARSHDGAEVPVSLLRLASTPRDGTAPLYLYGYGSYGISIPSGFSTARLSLVDRGIAFAIAHVRGGTEKGYGWYLDAKREKKANTFHDFIAVAEHLVAQGYCAKGKIVAHGGSAGGMVMGAISNMRPDLFTGIIADVPFVDVLNTILDDTLPLTPPEWPEWGNPISNQKAFETILSYCPYSNVKKQAYPAIFALGGVSDPRVTYWEPAKWVAKLRTHKTNDAPILLKINMSAGHGGASGRFSALEEIAEKYIFALKVLGLTS